MWECSRQKGSPVSIYKATEAERNPRDGEVLGEVAHVYGREQ